MKSFANLHKVLEYNSLEEDKVQVLKEYFETVSEAEAAWALFFLSGRSLKQFIKGLVLKSFAQKFAACPDWLFQECLDVVGDLSETISLILPAPVNEANTPLDIFVENNLLPLRDLPESKQLESVSQSWSSLGENERLVFNKILTGTYRSLVSSNLLCWALSELHQVKTHVLALRLAKLENPSAQFFSLLCQKECSDVANEIPYPFSIAKTFVEADAPLLGNLENWQVEWKWDGIRAQLIKRDGIVSIWSQEDQIMTDLFPELIAEAKGLADGVVLDGEILAWKDADLLPLQMLEPRLNRKSLSRKVQEETPVIFMATDLLEDAGKDIRNQQLEFRRERLADVLSSRSSMKSSSDFEQLRLFAPCQVQLSPSLRISPALIISNWEELKDARSTATKMKMAGLLMKKKGDEPSHKDYWLWSLEPIRLNVVLIAAQASSGKRTGVCDDYTLAVWKDKSLVPLARTSHGLSEEDVLKVDDFIRTNTLEKYGPVRSVKPELVFEISVDRIQISQKHKSGFVARGAKILRLNPNLEPENADDINKILSVLMVKATLLSSLTHL